MKRPFLTVSLAVVLIFVTLASFVPDTNGLVNDVLSQTNQFRKSKGLPALQMKEDLNEIARKHSENMARGRVGFGHGGFNQREKEAKKKIDGMHAFAENVAYGANTGKEVVNMWKNSSGHRRNMLGRYKYIGIGTAKDKRGRIYYTQVFAD
jgi:uncharacterized protein YkwD